MLSVTRNSRVEAGSNTSTVILRVAGGDEKGNLEPKTKLNSVACSPQANYTDRAAAAC
jgi:hypothetical protein